MLISTLNPFIRYAAQIFIIPQKKFSIASDCRIFFIVEGDEKGSVRITDNTYTLKTNTLFYIPSNTPYKFSVTNSIKVIAINFDLSQYNSDTVFPLPLKTYQNLYQLNVSKPNELIADCDNLNHHIFLTDGTFLHNSLDDIMRIHCGGKKYFREKASAILKLLLINIVTAYEKKLLYSSSSYDKNEKLIYEVKNFIKNNYKENLTNDTIARHVDYHSYHLNRIFQNFEGVSIHKYLNNYRILMAEKLLLETDETVTFIATEVGFDNTTSFTQNFKNKNSTTPLRYRNLHKKFF